MRNSLAALLFAFAAPAAAETVHELVSRETERIQSAADARRKQAQQRTKDLVESFRSAALELRAAGCSENVQLHSSRAKPALYLACEALEETGRGSRSMVLRQAEITAAELEKRGFALVQHESSGYHMIRDVRRDALVGRDQWRAAFETVRAIILEN